MIKEYFIDKDEKAIRGGMINVIITLSILTVTCYGLLFSDVVTKRLVDSSMFIVSFFTASYGIYSFKKHMGDRLGSAENIANIQRGNILPQNPPPPPGQPITQPPTYQPPPVQPVVVPPPPVQPVVAQPIPNPPDTATQPTQPTTEVVVSVSGQGN